MPNEKGPAPEAAPDAPAEASPIAVGGGTQVVRVGEQVAGARQPSARQRLMRVATGTLLGDRFKVVRVLGRGAMGAMYLVEDLMLGGAPLVLKLMSPFAVDEPEELELFRREVVSARAVA